jgi:hypothetical protein
MAYDEELAHRVRELLADEYGLSEMRMFGGQGELMVRMDPGTTRDALAQLTRASS